jgi:hypothetical protein
MAHYRIDVLTHLVPQFAAAAGLCRDALEESPKRFADCRRMYLRFTSRPRTSTGT